MKFCQHCVLQQPGYYLKLVVIRSRTRTETYLNGVGSFRLLTLLGLLIVLTALLA
jgi:hypothetical protein